MRTDSRCVSCCDVPWIRVGKRVRRLLSSHHSARGPKGVYVCSTVSVRSNCTESRDACLEACSSLERLKQARGAPLKRGVEGELTRGLCAGPSCSAPAPLLIGPGDSPGWAMHTPHWALDRPTASRCSVVGFVTPPHRAAAGGPPEAEDGRGGPGRALGGSVSVYTL